MVEIIWTEVALDDLKLIHEYIAYDSKRYADRFIAKLITRVDQLKTYSNAGRIVPEFSSSSIRELIEGNYRIIYKISIPQIAIIRVHHAARQLKKDN